MEARGSRLVHRIRTSSRGEGEEGGLRRSISADWPKLLRRQQRHLGAAGAALMRLGGASWPRGTLAGKQRQGTAAVGILGNVPKELCERWTFQR